MSQYTQIPQTSKPDLDDEDLLESLQNIPSHFDLALNGVANRTYLSANPMKEPEVTLLDPEAFRRLSISTISSRGLHSRGVSPFPNVVVEPRTWKSPIKDFWNNYQGLLLVSISQLFGALMNVTARLLELEGEGMHPFQLLFARMSLTTCFCCAWMWWKKVPDPMGIKGIRWLLLLRGLSGFFGIFGMYYSLQYLPIADAVVITFLAPSVAAYACYLFLKEPFSRSAQYASLVSLLGVVLIARPTSFFTSSSPPTPEFPVATNNSTAPAAYDADFPVPTSAQRLSAVAVAMLGVLGAAGAFTTIRWIGNRAHPLVSVNYFAVMCTIVSTLALTLAEPLGLSSSLHFALPAGIRQWLMLIFLGICGFIMQFLLTLGLTHGAKSNTAKSTHFIYTNMLFALALDKLVFGQSPGWWSLGGSGLILGSAVFVALNKEQTSSTVHPRDTDEELGNRNVNGTEEEEMRMLSGGSQEEWEDEAEELRGRT